MTTRRRTHSGSPYESEFGFCRAIRAGDRILFGKWSGTEITLDGKELLIMKESDILGIIG